MPTVLQPWVEDLPWKQQSILFSALRGPDNVYYKRIKEISKWMRFVSQNNADPSKAYMNRIDLPEPQEIEKELEHLPCHFAHHFADGLAVIAYGHPNQAVREQAYAYHCYIAEEIFHFIPEPPDIFQWRHQDNVTGGEFPPKPYDDRPWTHRCLPVRYVSGAFSWDTRERERMFTQ